MSFRPQHAAVMENCVNLARFLESLLQRTATKTVGSVFECIYPPGMSLESFATRLGRYLHCSPEAIICAAVLADRLYCADSAIFSKLSLHKIMLTASMIAIKFCDDKYYPNSHYAECGGVTLLEMNAMELEFIKILNFGLFVSPAQFDMGKRGLETIRLRALQPSTVVSKPVCDFSFFAMAETS